MTAPVIKTAVFAGSFDPVTKGHEDIVVRALSLFDRIIVAVGNNSSKNYYFPADKRLDLLRQTFSKYPSVVVMNYSGLTVDFCREQNAGYILRGLRNANDFEFERSIAQMNKGLNPEVETILIFTSPSLSAINSTIVRDILRNGGDPSQFLPEGIIL